jgi:hypothetical protein
MPTLLTLPVQPSTYEYWQSRLPLKRLETLEELFAAKRILAELAKLDLSRNPGAHDYCKTLIILVTEADFYFEQRNELGNCAESLVEQVDQLIYTYKDYLDSSEFENQLLDVSTVVSKHLYGD